MTTTSLPAFLVSTIRLATRLMPSASATEEPPYFCTIRPTAHSFDDRSRPAPCDRHTLAPWWLAPPLMPRRRGPSRVGPSGTAPLGESTGAAPEGPPASAQ